VEKKVKVEKKPSMEVEEKQEECEVKISGLSFDAA